jgi:acetyl-CoA acetyltransferase
VAWFGGQAVSQLKGASMVAEKGGFSREATEMFSLESHNRALRAQSEGRFGREIMPRSPRRDGHQLCFRSRADAKPAVTICVASRET